MSVSARPRSANLVFPSKTTYRARQTQSRAFSVSFTLQTAPRRTQDFTSGYASSYDPTLDDGRGPMFNKAKYGVPHFYPRDLKKKVDEYVVGQNRAKKTICSVIFNHYQSLRRRTEDEEEERTLREKRIRQKYRAREPEPHDGHGNVHPVEDEWPGEKEALQQSIFDLSKAAEAAVETEDSHKPHRVKIDKSNLLLIGPTGVGKTYILETLSKQLKVPFTISDCNSFTQAGYIGQDVENCIERLLIESNYSLNQTERGIVVLDEFDKIAKRETMNGRDVGGEGVQQALLKLVEGTKVTINVKDRGSTRSASPLTSNYGPSGSTTTMQATPATRVDQYVVDTSNILFVFCGAFVGLDKLVLRRVSKPSIGFGSEIRSTSSSSMSGSKTDLPAELYAHLPHQPTKTDSLPGGSRSSGFTPLDLTTPVDLQAFGFIPELIGRLHNITALSPLSLDELYRILTEPRNSLVAQYTALFETYPSRLYFTQRSLYAIAERAVKNETGARGLKMEMERVLAEPIFDAPMPYVLITEGCVKGTEKAGYWGKDGRLELERRLHDEDAGLTMASNEGVTSFEQYRVAGQSGG